MRPTIIDDYPKVFNQFGCRKKFFCHSFHHTILIYASLDKKVILFVNFFVHISHFNDKKPEKQTIEAQISNNGDVRTSEFFFTLF